jgi:hypothetical protein
MPYQLPEETGGRRSSKAHQMPELEQLFSPPSSACPIINRHIADFENQLADLEDRLDELEAELPLNHKLIQQTKMHIQHVSLLLHAARLQANALHCPVQPLE